MAAGMESKGEGRKEQGEEGKGKWSQELHGGKSEKGNWGRERTKEGEDRLKNGA